MKKLFGFIIIVVAVVALAIPTGASCETATTLINAKTNSGESGQATVSKLYKRTILDIDFSSGASAGEVTIYVSTSTSGQWAVWGTFTPANEPYYVVIPVEIGAVKAAITSTVTGKTVTVRWIKEL